MAQGRREGYVKDAIERLEDINDEVQDIKKDVHELLEELKEEMRESDSLLLKNAHFIYGGSSYERTAVNAKTDFDIAVVLPAPFGADNFTLTEAHEPGFYKLKPLERDDYKDRINSRGFLKVKELKEDAIDELLEILRRIRKINSNWTLKCSENVNSIQVLMRVDGGTPIKIDLVPVLRESIQNAVRLVKLTSAKRGWKKDFGLRAFHIKRIAIKYFDELDELSDWEAYISLLMHLSNELMDGIIDGFLLYDQNIYRKDKDESKTLASKINEAANTIKPHHLKNLFTN